MADIFERFHSQLLDNFQVSKVCVEDIFYDDVLTEIIERANPISGLRSSSHHDGDCANLFNLAALQSPLICYRYRNHYRILAGVFTLNFIRKGLAHRQLRSGYEIPVFVLDKKPTMQIRRHIIQYDLTNSLLSKCFVSDTKKISYFLRSWFEKDEGKRSIFQSKEWLLLYPNLSTTEKLARFLSVSKKDL